MALEDLSPQDIEYLSVLVAQDIRNDKQAGRTTLVALHIPVWEKLQTPSKQPTR